MGNKVYTDLKKEYIKEKHETIRMEVIEMMVKKYSNDQDLGEAVRKFVNIKENTKEDLSYD